MLYSFPVSPSIVFGAPCWVVSLGTAFLYVIEKKRLVWGCRRVPWRDEKNKKNKNKKKQNMWEAGRGRP